MDALQGLARSRENTVPRFLAQFSDLPKRVFSIQREMKEMKEKATKSDSLSLFHPSLFVLVDA